MQPSRRPKDGRYGENPNRLQHYYQYQVVLKPAPPDILELYLGSLEALGFDLKAQRRALRRGRLGEPDARRLGPGLGSLAERHGGHAVHLLPAGRRHRLQADHRRDHLRPRAPGDVPAGRGERLRPGVDRVAEGADAPPHLPRRLPPERGRADRPTTSSTATSSSLLAPFGDHEAAAQAPDGSEARAARPTSRCSRRRTPSTCSMRAARSPSPSAPAYIGRIRNLARAVAQSYYESRERLGFPMLAPEGRVIARAAAGRALRRGAAAARR